VRDLNEHGTKFEDSGRQLEKEDGIICRAVSVNVPGNGENSTQSADVAYDEVDVNHDGTLCCSL